MDWTEIDEYEIENFIRRHLSLPRVDLSKEELIQSAQQLWNDLASRGELTIPNLTSYLVNRYIALQVKEQFGAQPPYLLSTILSIPETKLNEFRQIFGIPFPAEGATLSDWEYLRDRLVEILMMADLLDNDIFPNRHPQEVTGRRRVELFEIDLPNYEGGPVIDVTAGELEDEDIEEFFPEEWAEAEENDEDSREALEDLPLYSKILERVQRMVRDRETQLVKGDILRGRRGSYGNQETFIFDGEKFTVIDFHFDDYGNLPPEYRFPEFPFNYWYPEDNLTMYAIDNNYFQWIDVSLFEDELGRNMRGPFSRTGSSGLEPVPVLLYTQESRRSDIHPDESHIYRTYIDYQGRRYHFQLRGYRPYSTELPEMTIGEPDFSNGLIEYVDGYFYFGGDI